MNQVTNLIQWVLLTKEQKAQFCSEAKKRGMYEFYYSVKGEWQECRGDAFCQHNKYNDVYRLKILPDEWYYQRPLEAGSEILQGKFITNNIRNCASTLRPAKPEEIPEPEPTLLERIELRWMDNKVVMLDRKQQDEILGYWPLFGFTGHTHAQSMKGFYGYIYNHSGLEMFRKPTKAHQGKTVTPIAVLFNK